jgi:hypothetical protein
VTTFGFTALNNNRIILSIVKLVCGAHPTVTNFQGYERMQEQRKEFPLRTWQIVLMVILTPIIFGGGYGILYKSIIKIWVLRRMPISLSFFLILAFDAGWLIMMIKLPLKSIKLKIILTWLIVVLSASLMTYLFILDILRGAFM